MDEFREFVLAIRLQHFGIALPLNLILNTLAMWYTVNKLVDPKEKVSWGRCLACVVLLYAVSGLAVYSLVFPFPIMFVLAFLFWLGGSILVIKSVLQLMDGGFTILFVYLCLLVVAHGVAHLLV